MLQITFPNFTCVTDCK